MKIQTKTLILLGLLLIAGYCQTYSKPAATAYSTPSSSSAYTKPGAPSYSNTSNASYSTTTAEP